MGFKVVEIRYVHFRDELVHLRSQIRAFVDHMPNKWSLWNISMNRKELGQTLRMRKLVRVFVVLIFNKGIYSRWLQYIYQSSATGDHSNLWFFQSSLWR